MKNLKEVQFVYHATYAKYENSIKTKILIDRPGVFVHLDFGKGFYTTTNFEQAKERAVELAELEVRSEFQKMVNNPNNKKTIAIGQAIVLKFKLDEFKLFTVSENECCIFREGVSKDWAEFIANNRYKNHEFKHNYKWTYGLMADGKGLFAAVNAYKTNQISLEEFLKIINPYKHHYDQLTFHDEKFVNSGVLKNPQVAFRKPITIKV